MAAARLPYANTALTRFIDRRVAEFKGERTQRQIATDAGFELVNAFSMLKCGAMKAPLTRIPALARALDADPRHLFQLGLIDHWPELAPVIGDIFGGGVASRNEVDILLSKWWAATENTDPAPNAQISAAVDTMIVEALK